jgi:hypothetical protein
MFHLYAVDPLLAAAQFDHDLAGLASDVLADFGDVSVDAEHPGGLAALGVQ